MYRQKDISVSLRTWVIRLSQWFITLCLWLYWTTCTWTLSVALVELFIISIVIFLYDVLFSCRILRWFLTMLWEAKCQWILTIRIVHYIITCYLTHKIFQNVHPGWVYPRSYHLGHEEESTDPHRSGNLSERSIQFNILFRNWWIYWRTCSMG